MEAKKSNSIKVFLYISVWVIIWGTIGSLVDYPLYKYKNEIIKKPINNTNGDNCTGVKIKLICKLILRLQFLWIIIFFLIFFNFNFNLIIN